DLVHEGDVPRCVDELQLVTAQRHRNRLRLDRDPALSLELHRVEELLAHLALGDGTRELEDPVGERRLAVVDVRDDREVTNAVLLHGLREASATTDPTAAKPTPSGIFARSESALADPDLAY